MTPGRLFLFPVFLSDWHEPDLLPAYNHQQIKHITYFLVENERSARRFLSSLKLQIDIASITMLVLDKDTQASQIGVCLTWLQSGYDVGVLSEAGCPGIADPGSIAVALAHKHQITVVPLVGPSSITLALMASGLNGQRFCFHGYLPIEKIQRAKVIKTLEQESRSKGMTQIVIETPYRNNSLIADILQNCLPDTQLCIAAGLQSQQPMVRTLTCKEWKKQLPQIGKVPAIFLFLA